MTQCITPESVNEAFIANTPLISSTIRNMTLQAPNWFRDLYVATPWPQGEGTIMQQFVFRGELPAVEEGFDSWGLVDDPSGCSPSGTPNCSYNMSVLGGHSFDTKITRLMTRDFRTPDYCVKSIQNTRQFQEVFSAIVANLYNQINFQKEVNVGQNYLTSIAKKLVVDSEGFKANPEDPYAYRPKGTATLSALNIGILERMYEVLRRMPDAVPYDIQNGSPLYAMVCSPELISRLYRDDASLRADLRHAGGQFAADLVQKYNFTNTIRDMFFPVPYLYPRRFRYDSVNSAWVRVLPFVKGVPGQVGTYSGMNPLYEDPAYATHEEVLIHGRDPFAVFYQPTVETIGEGTDFGPEPGFWDTFHWVNPQTREDPARREGFFFTTATIGLSAQMSEGVFGMLVPRPSVATMVSFYPALATPPESTVTTNVVPAVGCPTPLVLSVVPHPITAGRYYVTFGAPVLANVSDVIQLGLTTGGYVSATVVSKNAGAGVAATVFEVTISGTVPSTDRFVSVYTGESLGCRSAIDSYTVDAADNTRLDLVLDRPIKADTASDSVTLFYGNGSTVTATVVSVNMLTNVWKVDIGASAFVDNVGGVKEICVPTATDASCGSCSATLTSATQCS